MVDQQAPPEGWTLDEFVAAVAAALRPRGLQGAPDRRTVRYYATVGVIDKPHQRGREVRYDDRHLSQVVDTKERQARGERLADIARERAGDVAGNGATAVSTGSVKHDFNTNSSGTGGAFWEAQPHLTPTRPPGPDREPGWHPRTVWELAPGVELHLPGPRPTDTEITRLRDAAEPLRRTLAAMGLTSGPLPHPASPTPPATPTTDHRPTRRAEERHDH
ncbi:hypothetical protein [Microlunatus sp. Y2014]|uniref:hypothetical protein n=1 Tax=Microlunatus sp. Y2014 TaxID=3418488 RepID=UPI003DA6EA74